MPDKATNKVVFGGDVLIDLTSDTADESSVLSGRIFHKRDGSQATGACTYDADTSDATATASEILNGKTAYVSGNELTGTMPNRGAVSGYISDKDVNYQVPQGYHDGSGTVGIDATEKAKIVGSNIRQGVVILGVEGTLEPDIPVKVTSATATPTVSQQTVVPPTGYDYLTQVTINAIPYEETDNAAGGKTVTIAGV